MLEDLVVSENHLDDLPPTIQTMQALKVLRLQNNRLRTLPYEIGEILTLEEIDCSNNNDLDLLPPAWRGDTESILFICRINRENKARIDEMTEANADLKKHSQYLEQEQIVMKVRHHHSLCMRSKG